MPHPVSSERIWKELEPREHFSNKSDGLTHGGKPFCLGTALGLLTALETVREEVIPGLKIPFSINHGTHDEAVLIEGSEFLWDRSDSPADDKAFNKIEGGFHDLYSELEAEKTLGLEIKWIKEQIAKKRNK